jgi:hypothetical protein
MKKLFILSSIALFFNMGVAHGQTTKTDTTRPVLEPNDTSMWKINLLRAPASPGASLLGISPNSIQRPSDPSALMVSLLNSTDNLSTIPNSYAIDFAPAWLFWGKNIKYNDFISGYNPGKSIPETFDISVAIRNSKDSLTNQTNTRVGFGFSVSIIRGDISDKTKKAINDVHNHASNYALLKDKYEQDVENQPNFFKLSIDAQSALLAAADQKAHSDDQAKAELDAISKAAKAIDFTRYGWMLDLAGGLAYNFVNQSKGTLYNSGLWLTGGYEFQQPGISLLGIVRYLDNPANTGVNLSADNYQTMDYGARFLYDAVDNKFTVGIEGIYRSVSGTTAVKSSWRYAFSADYQVGANQVLSFNIGRDFDGTINKSGNMIAALNFLIGFGNNRPVQ